MFSFCLTVGSAVVYVGAYDIAMDNTFTWLDGSPFTGPWGPSQPNNYAMNETSQNCVIMEGLYGYNFSDTQCTSPYNFLCQITGISLSK